jgi:CRP-like cAMP-binding protein
MAESTSKQSPVHVRGENRLLQLLTKDDRDRLLKVMTQITTEHGEPVFKPNKRITHVHFPLHGVISMVVEMRNGEVAEVGTIGNEGNSGLAVQLGADTSPNSAFCQVPGESQRMSVGDFREEMSTNQRFEKVMRLGAQGFVNQVAQTTACNRLHTVERRLCRWILMCHDRVGEPTVNLTQQFIAQMLGVRRASIGVVAGSLQEADLIRYSRGRIEIVSRPALERAACECYGVVRKEYERLLR